MVEKDINRVNTLKSRSSLESCQPSTFTPASCSVRFRRELKRRFPNIPSVLLILYSVPGFCCLFTLKSIAFSLIYPSTHESCFEEQPLEPKDMTYSPYILRTLQSTVTYLAFPVMGWIAEVLVGRTKMVTFSIHSMWLGMVFVTLSYVLQQLTCGIQNTIVNYSLTSLGMIFLIAGTAGFFADLPAYILEQMISEPSDKLRSAVNWLTWSMFIGLSIRYTVLPQNHSPDTKSFLLLSVSFTVTFLCSVMLIVHQIFSRHFVKVGTMKKNPSKLIWNVVLYAFRQPRSKRRSALSYWDSTVPDRYYFAKETNGGQFTDEEVEDVKSFWRVFFVICTLIGFYIPFSAISDDGLTYIEMFLDSTAFLNSHILFALINGIFSIVMIPLLEFVLIPCFPRLDYWFQNSLRGIGISYLIFLVSLVLVIILDVVGQSTSKFKTTCYLKSGGQYKVSFVWYTGPLLLFCFADALNFSFSMQFIMSQAPLRMCGLLTGIYWLLRAIGSNLAVFIKIPFDHFDHDIVLSCSFWILLIHSVICFLGMICFILVARSYQKRRKNVDFLGKEIVEEYYERQLNDSDEPMYPPLLSKSVNYFKYTEAALNVGNVGIQ